MIVCCHVSLYMLHLPSYLTSTPCLTTPCRRPWGLSQSGTRWSHHRRMGGILRMAAHCHCCRLGMAMKQPPLPLCHVLHRYRCCPWRCLRGHHHTLQWDRCYVPRGRRAPPRCVCLLLTWLYFCGPRAWEILLEMEVPHALACLPSTNNQRTTERGGQQKGRHLQRPTGMMHCMKP